MIAGGLRGVKQRLVEAWAELYQEELVGRLAAVARRPGALADRSVGGKKMMAHPIFRVLSFSSGSTLMYCGVQFDDQTEQVIDFKPVLAGELYRPLRI